ncbi:MAG: type III pantothenate kinase [Roseibacillus sp.]|nr:type III pantothenate kinase [Roseibacillus sp.]
MRLLLIDNSNTRTKFAVADSINAPLETHHVATADVCPAFIKTLKDLDFEAAVLSSVVPEKAALFREVLSPAPLHEISCRSDLPIDIAYPDPDQIGADRLANAVSAYARVGAPAIVVDFGTAVTFDVLGGTRDSGSYLGGVIAPGLPSMTDYLHRNTALLPEIDLQEPSSAIGKSTTDAMRSGAVHGYRGMVREVLGAIQNELDENPTVLATGGDATLIAAGLPEIMEVVRNLTLQGIYLIGERNLT